MVKFSDIFSKDNEPKKDLAATPVKMRKTLDFASLFKAQQEKEAVVPELPQTVEKKPEKVPEKITEKNSAPRQSVSLRSTPLELSGLLNLDKSDLPESNLKSKLQENEPVVVEEKKEILNGVNDVYRQGILLADKIFSSSNELADADFKRMLDFVESLVDYVSSDSQELLELVFTKEKGEVNVYALNLLNVSILALEIGKSMNFSRPQLIKLGLAAFLHDIGMKVYSEMIGQSKKLNASEKKNIQNHPFITVEMLRRIRGDMANEVADIVAQTHERVNGTGYPRGIKGQDIDEYAQIIGLVDVYEALTHQRPYRNIKYPPQEAIKVILRDNKDNFSPKLTKAFIERIGFFPRGTFVELNTKEIACVTKQNFKMPTCPLVKVIYDNEGKLVRDGREIDLAKNTQAFVIKSV